MKKVRRLKLTDWLSGDKSKKESFEKDFSLGLREHGFIILEDHSVSTELLNKAYDQSKTFFNKEEEYKKQFISESNFSQRGYTPYKTEHAKGSSTLDLKEFYHVGRDLSKDHEKFDSFPKNIFVNKEFEEVFTQLFKELDTCSKHLLKALTPSLKLKSDYFDNFTSCGNSILRLLHYPPIGKNEDPNALRAEAHGDINLITLLVAAEGKGLQLQDKDGEWIDIETKKGEIVVDTGDMMSRMTNNFYPSTIHRVVNGDQQDKSRYSMPFFVHPNGDDMLKVLDHLKDGKEESDILVDDFLHQRLVDIGLIKK